jgi:uncharacterized membrane protein YqjE
VLALTLDTAKNVAIVAVTVLVILAIAASWLMKTIVQKLVAVAILGLFAFAIWTQRGSLEDCADKVLQNFDASGGDVTVSDTDCSFFGVTVTISDPRN